MSSGPHPCVIESTVPFAVRSVGEHPFGILAVVSLPPGREPVPVAVLRRLHAAEALDVSALRGFEQVRTVGGRLAARAAAEALGALDWRVRRGAHGEPVAPDGFAVSIAHKRDLAVALVSPVPGDAIGVDLEDDATAARAIADVFLLEDERAALEQLGPSARNRALLATFALKEAIYKALARRLGRSLVYPDARILFEHGRPRIEMLIDEPLPELLADCVWWGERVLAAVRCK